ncbi:MAG: hypothetical protein C5B51_28670 [Terriglobia bacterium]|nr:MAG: hypothetical protein C5B51_28670 [Terriglobia bacterium]
MRRSGLSKISLAVLCVPAALVAQTLTREGGRWVQTITGTTPAAARLRVNSQGPVHLEGRAANEITYTAKLSVQVRSEDDARRILSRYALRVASAGDLVVLTAPGGPVATTLSIRAPRLNAATITTPDGGIEANAIDGILEVTTGAGEVKCDRIRGDCNLSTGGGDIQTGEVDGDLQASTAGGRIMVKNVRGDAVLQTAGGDVEVTDAGSTVHADTAGGTIRVGSAGGAVSASTGGGSIIVGKAGGIVTARNVAGPVQVGAAAGVRCESGTGGIRVSNISGPMDVSTAFGSIVASLLSGRPLSDSFLATGNGDITALIPSNVGVTIRAQSDRRIVSDFPGVTVRVRGPLVVAEGAVNGGGPVLRISGAGGTINIKRQ